MFSLEFMAASTISTLSTEIEASFVQDVLVNNNYIDILYEVMKKF
jgi:hypothetical protein